MNVLFVKGDDEGLVRDKVRELVRELAGDDSFAVEDFDDDDYDVGHVLDACLTPPFLGDRRVVVARRVGRFKSDDLQPLLDWMTDPMPTTVLVLASGGGDVSRKLEPAVKKVGTVVDTRPGTGKARRSWLVERLAEAPVRLDAAAGNRLIEHLGEDVGRLHGILDALATAYGEGARVGLEELQPFLGEAGAVAPWDLTDAIDQGRTEDALVHLHRMMEAGERHPLAIMATLQRHYAAMLRLDGVAVRDAEAAAAVLGTARFPAEKALTQSRRLGSVGIARAFALLAEADLGLRGAQGWPPELVMEVLIARLSRLGARARTRNDGARRAPSRAGR